MNILKKVIRDIFINEENSEKNIDSSDNAYVAIEMPSLLMFLVGYHLQVN